MVENKTYFSLSADYRNTDGFYRNSFQNNAAIVDALESYNVNARLVWDASDALSIDTKLRVGSVDASSITFNSTFNLPVLAAAFANPSAYQDVNDFDFLFQSNVTSDNDQDVLRSYQYGAQSYICKPLDFPEFSRTVCETVEYWLGLNRPVPRLRLTRAE